MRPRYNTSLLRSACRPRRIITLGISLVVVVTIFISIIAHHHQHTPSPHPHFHNKLSIPSLGIRELLKIICKHTLFPDSCLSELSCFNISAISLHPSHIVSLSVQAAAGRVDEAYQLATQCSSEQGLHLLESQCAHDCIDLMADTKDHLKAAVSKLSNLHVKDITSLERFLRDVKVWLSCSLSYQTACSDGFDLAPGSIQGQIQNKQDYVAEVIGNAIALVEILAQIGDDLSCWLGDFSPSPPITHLRRRLLSPSAEMSRNYDDQGLFEVHDGFPHWVSAAERKLLQAPESSLVADITVAQDGSGDFLNVTDALNGIPQGYQGRYVIYIKEGIYEEVFNVTKDLENITFVGDGIGYTVITSDRNVASGLFNTYRTATVGEEDNNLMLYNKCSLFRCMVSVTLANLLLMHIPSRA
eukprot:c24911_g9_i2 orf=95-1336(-)